MIKLMEHAIEAEKLFLVSPACLLSPCPRSSELTSLIVSLLQSLSEQMKAKNNFLRKIIPLAMSARTLAREKEIAMAEACAASHAELRSLREENRAMREQILELTGSSQGRSPVRPFVRHPLSALEALLVFCAARGHAASQLEIEAKRLRCELRASKEPVIEIQAEVEYVNRNNDTACAELKAAREALSQAQEGLESLRKALEEVQEREAEAANQLKLGEAELASTLLFPSYMLILPFA